MLKRIKNGMSTRIKELVREEASASANTLEAALQAFIANKFNQLEFDISNNLTQIRSDNATLLEEVKALTALTRRPLSADEVLKGARTLAATMIESQQYEFAENLSREAYPEYKFSDFGRCFLRDESFLEFYQRFMDPNNWHSLDRKWMIKEAMKAVCSLTGDYAECGVYNGFTAYLMCQSAAASGKQVHLFDSWEGLSKPGSFDGDYWVEGRFALDVAVAQKSLQEFTCATFHKGWIPDRFADVEQKQFSFVHIDVDLFQPTWDSLEFFYPRLVNRGWIICDDYGFRTCPGVRKALQEFFADRTEPVFDLPTGQGLVIKQ